MRIIFGLKHTIPVPIRNFMKREAFIATGITGISAHNHSRVDRFPASYSGGRRFKSRPRN